MVADVVRVRCRQLGRRRGGCLRLRRSRARCVRSSRRRSVRCPLEAAAGVTRTTARIHTARSPDASGLLACAYGGLWEHGPTHLVDLVPTTMATCRATDRAGPRQPCDVPRPRRTSGCRRGRGSCRIALATDSGLLEHRSTADAFYALGETHRLALQHDQADDAFVAEPGAGGAERAPQPDHCSRRLEGPSARRCRRGARGPRSAHAAQGDECSAAPEDVGGDARAAEARALAVRWRDISTRAEGARYSRR